MVSIMRNYKAYFLGAYPQFINKLKKSQFCGMAQYHFKRKLKNASDIAD